MKLESTYTYFRKKNVFLEGKRYIIERDTSYWMNTKIKFGWDQDKLLMMVKTT